MNFAYPDLHYVKKYGNAPGAQAQEETIEGNVYFAGGGIQNNVGEGCELIINPAGNPVVFYYAELPDGNHGLRTAVRQNGGWTLSWVETGIQVVHISAAIVREGNVAVAYRVRNFSDSLGGEISPSCLRFAEEPLVTGGEWRVTMVDDRSVCGHYPSLSSNALGGWCCSR